MTAYIGYDNLIPLGTVTASDQPGYEKENAYDWFTYTWWQGVDTGILHYAVEFIEPVSANYFGVASHKIFDANNPGSNYIRLQYHDGIDYVDASAIIYPTSNAPIFLTFTEQTSTLWRFRMYCIDYPGMAGVLSFGQVSELPEGIKPAFTPPPWGHDDVIISSKSQSGVFLGRSIERYGLKHTIRQTQVDPAWMRENWLDLAEALRIQPFFYSWDYENYPEDTVYAWLDDKMPVPMYTNPVYTDFSINCRCIHDPKQSPVP